MSGVTWEAKVRELRIIAVLLIVLAVLPASLGAQNSRSSPKQGAGQTVNPAAQVSALRIMSPKAGEHLRQDYVNVQYEFKNDAASAAGMPTFRVKLDSQDPVTTSATNYTFNGLKPGPHTVMVQLVDANGTPITGAEGEVQFIVPQPSPGPGAATAAHGGLLKEIVSAIHIRPR